ncbi:MAG: hypothetical protein L3J47_04670 [Sulfurovum sp.]|nr:hypothetical protein [Sulfurovum sp.]
MEKMTIKSYATKHKLSIFNVVKMVKSGQLKSELVEENGKEVTYVLAENTKAPLQTEIPAVEETSKEYLVEKVARLEQDVAILKRELDALKMSIGIK